MCGKLPFLLIRLVVLEHIADTLSATLFLSMSISGLAR